MFLLELRVAVSVDDVRKKTAVRLEEENPEGRAVLSGFSPQLKWIPRDVATIRLVDVLLRLVVISGIDHHKLTAHLQDLEEEGQGGEG